MIGTFRRICATCRKEIEFLMMKEGSSGIQETNIYFTHTFCHPPIYHTSLDPNAKVVNGLLRQG